MKRNRNWREIWENNLWAVKLWWSIDPKLFFSTAFPAIVEAVTPYITVWLSAQIINELSCARDPQTLWKWVILTVSVTAGGKILVNGTEIARGMPHLSLLSLQERDRFYGQRLLKDGEWWMVGESATSLDSRYWGPLKEEQVVGRAHVIY